MDRCALLTVLPQQGHHLPDAITGAWRLAACAITEPTTYEKRFAWGQSSSSSLARVSAASIDLAPGRRRDPRPARAPWMPHAGVHLRPIGPAMQHEAPYALQLQGCLLEVAQRN